MHQSSLFTAESPVNEVCPDTRKAIEAKDHPVQDSLKPEQAGAKMKSSDNPGSVTPMMQQYLEIKQQYSNTILFYRMGDFYEMFFEDAIEAAEILDITLTKRGKHLGKDIAMCGVPIHQADNYLRRLIACGRQVTICEQTESPEQAKKRGGSKALVTRAPVRVVTAGTILDDELLEPDQSNHLAAIIVDTHCCSVAWLEMASGAFYVQTMPHTALDSLLAEIQPTEILCDETSGDQESTRALYENIKLLLPDTLQISALSKAYFRFDRDINRLIDEILIGILSESGRLAAQVVLKYVEHTQIGKLPKIQSLSTRQGEQFMRVDAATRRNLELVRTLNGEKKGALLAHIDRCRTPAGKRLLASWLLSPLCNAKGIIQRQDRITEFLHLSPLRGTIRDILRQCPDIHRPLSRLELGYETPRDLFSVSIALQKISNIQKHILEHAETKHHQQSWQALLLPDVLMCDLGKALNPEMPKRVSEGNVIARDFDDSLDYQRHLMHDARQLMMELQQQLQMKTGINTLKISHNNMLGYFVEVPRRFAEMLDDQEFVHRHTTNSGVRYSHAELIDLARKIDRAQHVALIEENRIFQSLLQRTLEYWKTLQLAAQLTAEVDVITGLAELAVQEQYCRPIIDNTTAFDIRGGRHPVVEKSLKDNTFIANDCALQSNHRLWLLSGPNMAGKSTFLRQNALITILAQMGSFVPAHTATIGLVDQLFSRVGAADDLARGHSTFMVEMLECAHILSRATPRSLVILDEIGRGTATFDGLSIAWACVEYLHGHNQSRGLFATHYHELSEALEDQLEHLSSYHMKVKEWQSEIVFLHEVTPGRATGSYGIHVARLAGLPPQAIQRAQVVLDSLEKNAPTLPQAHSVANDALAQVPEPEPHPLQTYLHNLDIDALSPRQALDVLYRLKQESAQ